MHQVKERSLKKAISRALFDTIPRNRMGDKTVALIDFVRTHRRLPRTGAYFNDAIYHIKISGELQDPSRVFTTDKELVKLYASATVGAKYAIPTIAVLSAPDDVDDFEFPDQCCIKPTHASGCVILRRNGEPIDRAEIKRWFDINYYNRTREGNYRDLRPKVIVEPLIFGGNEVRDYKFFCVNGVIRMIYVDVDRHTQHTRDVLDHNWNRQTFALGFPHPKTPTDKPANFEEMVEVVERLAADFNFVRVDLYSDGQTCFLGELTHCHGGSLEKVYPVSSERDAGLLLFGPRSSEPQSAAP